MPEYTDLAKIPIPLRAEADDMAAIIKASFRAADPLFVLRARDTADLAAKYSSVGEGTIITGTSQNAIWRANGDGTFSTVWSDTGWQNVSILNNWQTPQNLQYRVIGSICYWRGVLQAPSDAVASTEYAICNVPSNAQPTITTVWSTSGRNSTNVVSLNITSGILRGYIGTPTASYLGVPSPYPVD